MLCTQWFRTKSVVSYPLITPLSYFFADCNYKLSSPSCALTVFEWFDIKDLNPPLNSYQQTGLSANHYRSISNIPYFGGLPWTSVHSVNPTRSVASPVRNAPQKYIYWHLHLRLEKRISKNGCGYVSVNDAYSYLNWKSDYDSKHLFVIVLSL